MEMSKGTVLVVEDEFLIRMILVESLVDAGYEVFEASNVLEAIAVLGLKRIDALITDIDMPGGLDGLDLARMVSVTHHDMTIVIASGGHRLGELELPERASFIAKPYNLDGVISLIGDLPASLSYASRC